MIQERRHTKNEVLQAMLQHLPKHQPLRNNSQNKATPLLVLNKNLNHQNLAVMMMRHFQILFHPPRLLRQKIQNLFQRNQNLVQVKSNLCIHKSNFFQPDINLLYLLLFLQIYAESRGTNKGTPSLRCILNFHLVPNAPNFFSKYHNYLVSTTHILFFKCHVVLCHCP